MPDSRHGLGNRSNILRLLWQGVPCHQHVPVRSRVWRRLLRLWIDLRFRQTVPLNENDRDGNRHSHRARLQLDGRARMSR